MRIILCTLLLALASCKPNVEPVSPPVDPYISVTPKNVIESCGAPKERYFFPLFDDYYLITRHNNCAGINDLFTVMWPGNFGEKQLVSSRLLVVLYVESEEGKIKYELIKKYEGNEEYPNAMYYKLSSVPEVNSQEDTKDAGQ